MTRSLFISLVLGLFAFSVSFAQNGTLPVGTQSGTTPVGGQGGASGLSRSPNPIDPTSQLSVTGNLRAGRSFQGVVPYQSETDFRAPLGSTSLDSFLRDSAGSESFTRQPSLGGFQNVMPFYSPSGTATTLRSGPSGPTIFGSASPEYAPKRAGEYVTNFRLYQPAQPEPALPPIGEVQIQDLKPFTSTIEELNKSVELQLERLRREEALTKKQDDTVKDAETTLDRVDLQEELRDELALENELTLPESPMVKLAKVEPTKGDVYEQMRSQIQEFVEEEYSDSELEQVKGLYDTEPQKQTEQEKLSRVEMALKAQAILGEHETFASYERSKFNDRMAAGEQLMKAGKYYRAAEAYRGAAIFKPDDPLAVAGRAHALFAAGEYITSSYLLQKAIEMFPEYVRFRADIVEMIGSRDVVETRLADARKWYDQGKSGDLAFLLAYVYHSMDRPDQARAFIRDAAEQMPDSFAVKALKAVTDQSSGF